MARRLPPLRALETFEAICRHGGVARAAEELGVSPGAVSQQLRLLEDHVGRALFRRTGRRLELTAAGKPYFELVFEGFERLRDAQKLLERGIAGLAVSALPSLMVKWLAPRVYGWQQSRDFIDLRLEGHHREDGLENGTVDFRLTYGSRVVLHHRSAELFVDRVVPVASPRLAAELSSPAAIARLPLIHIDWRPDHPNGPTWDDWFAAAGIAPRLPAPERLYSLSGVALDAAVRGEGVALGQRCFIADDVASGRLAILSDLELPMPVPYFVAWNDATIRKPGARDFLDWLLGEAMGFR
ncbi:LysR substrate-binding domain-containing protein [Zavarzinia compransoris]|uniref:LysR substrate-binding domain-containing protein n=1 Tax=Zavarzinia marina TaxID=2911065 RepID=UPI001F255C9D|nr:LysR substrate-binding domain-containing protein [Zavarzinia marina]MCF4167315.1 LysR substrate-binding domain-containing protein [Zavarzinia marina]